MQEFVPARDGRITRVEMLGGKFLYAINVYTPGDSFNLCPADICQTTDGVALAAAACAVDAPKNGLRVEGYTPPADVIADVERIMEAAGIDVGGIEYMIDDRDGALLYYDVNALSNFVADAPRVVGFDPFARLVDYLEAAAVPMRYGYWMPVFGGWLRNVEDEGMAASWDYASGWRGRSEEIGFDLTLVAVQPRPPHRARRHSRAGARADRGAGGGRGGSPAVTVQPAVRGDGALRRAGDRSAAGGAGERGARQDRFP